MENRRTWLLMLAGALIAMLAVVSGCGGGGDDDDGDATEATTEKATDDSDRETATPEEDEGDNGDDEGGDASADLKKLAEEYKTFTGKVKYTAANFSGDSTLTSMTIYQKDGKTRVDIESSDGNVTMITTPEATFMCSEGQCIKYPADDESAAASVEGFTSLFSPEQIENDFDLPDGSDLEKSSENIAGIDAVCYSASGDLDEATAGDESGQVCFSESGLLLRLAFEGGGEAGSFEATEAADNVSDGDFEPPFPILDFNDLLGTPAY
jgi:hypothetical protein